MANITIPAWYIRDNAPTSTVGWSAVTPWAALTAVAAGVLRRQLATPTVGNERVFICIIAGTTLAAEPTWTITKGGTTAEAAGPTWMECTGQPGVNGDQTNSPTWATQKASSSVITAGLILTNNAVTFLFICTTGGTIGASQPSFNTTTGATTTDNTATWTCIGAINAFGQWAAPFARFQSVWGTGWASGTHRVYAGADHAETQAAAMTVTAAGTPSIVSIPTGTIPPTTVQTGASVTTTGANAQTWNFAATSMPYLFGATLSAGSGATNAGLVINNAAGQGVIFADTCTFKKLGTTGNGTAINSVNTRMVLTNPTFQLGSASDNIIIAGVIQGSSTIVQGAVTLTSGLFNPTSILVRDCDLSALGANLIFSGNAAGAVANVLNCKIAANATYYTPNGRGSRVNVVNTDSAGTNYTDTEIDDFGTSVQETTIVRSGGYSTNGTLVSRKITTTASATWTAPFTSEGYVQWNSVTGTNRVVTLYGIWNSASLPNNDQISAAIDYSGSASSPLGTLVTTTKANIFATGTALAADSTSNWATLAPARANSTAYSVGDVRVPAGNPTRIFFCTTAGTSAGSEPAGYASAVDGGSVTDGSAVFRAGMRFAIVATLSAPQPAQQGPIYATVNAALASSTWYIDGRPVLS